MDPTNATAAEFRAAREATGPADVSLWSILKGHRSDPLARWTLMRQEHRDVAHFRYGLGRTFFVSSADGARRVLQDNAGNYTKEDAAYSMLRRLFGNGLFTSEGSFWLRQRRLAQPAFHRQRIAAMGEVMRTAAQDLCAEWDARASSGETFSVAKDMASVTLKVVGDALFGAGLAGRTAAVGAAWDVLNAQVVERHRSMRVIPPVLQTRYDRAFRDARRTLFTIVDEIIAERRAHERESDDLLGMFMAARDADTGEQMSDRQLRDEVVTMLLAGHETTAAALSWVWTLLHQHPSARQSLEVELDRVLAGRAPADADVPKLVFTKAVIEEALRLRSPAYILMRHVKHNDVVCGCRVYAGGSVVISPLILHRHPDYWERPDAFVPERWLDAESEKKRPRFAYIPFSGGPRQCIGNAFAMMEATLVLATLAQRFEVRLAPGYVPHPEYLVIARPVSGVPATVHPRSRVPTDTSPARDPAE